MLVAQPINLSQSSKSKLESLSKSSCSSVRLMCRSKIVLLASLGKTNKEIALILSIDRETASRWRKRYISHGILGISKDLPRGGNYGPRSKKEQQLLKEEIIRKTTQELPKGATHWSTRSMAVSVSCQHSFVNRVWQEHGLKPHLIKNFKISNDPKFEEKLIDVVGLYMDPPEKAVVLCIDEKSSIQALDRTQPGLPLKKGRCGTMTHDYKRNGTSTLFAALDVASGKVIGQCLKKHRHQEFLKFLNTVDKNIDQELDLHIIVDNYATHKHPKVKNWLLKHPRFHFHFIPTSSSWLNLVERFFGIITEKQIRRGAFKSVEVLETCIYNFIENNNKNPKPFKWTKSTKEILDKIGRAKKALLNQ